MDRFHKWLDAGYGACALAQPPIRSLVAEAFGHFHTKRYQFREWVIMPNHVHVVVTPLAEHSLSDVMHSWKSYTAKRINSALGKDGTTLAKGVVRTHPARS